MKSQIHWILPIARGYAKKNNIKNIIIENDYKIKKTEDIDVSILKKNKYFFNILFWLKLFSTFLYFFYIFSFKKKISLQDNFESSIFHSISDTARLNSTDSEIKLKFNTIIYSIFYCSFKYVQAHILKNLGTEVVILGHSVYGSRSQIAYFREKKIKIFCQSSFNIFENSSDKDRSWNTPDISFLNKINKIVTVSNLNNFWVSRQKGFSSYIDASEAFKGIRYVKKNNFNVIMLHIFRDSPFSIIDNSRIYFDYYDWVADTLSIINNSNENWIIRIHPSGKRWGENSKLILQQIIKNSHITLNKNIIIDDSKFSNLDLLRKATKIITFSGTCHLEAASYGKKVICISEVMLSKFNKKLIFKVKSKLEYKRLIMSNNIDLFKISKKDQIIAKRLLYIREKIFSIKDDINGIKIYRNDSKKLFLKDELNSKVMSKIHNNKLTNIGFSLSKNLPQTINFKFFDILKNKGQI